jgi:hypothetical protein
MQAKLFSKWEEHLGQLIAEMVGSREEFAAMQLGKRKEEVALAMPKVWPLLMSLLWLWDQQHVHEAEADPTTCWHP